MVQGARGMGVRDYMERGNLVIHFYLDAGMDPASNQGGCYWRVEDVDGWYRECAGLGLAEEGIPRVTAPEDRAWGMREFALVDPSGNLMRIGQRL